ncbi:MAG: substrate-binding domain-containing protein, partial [Candidatus Methanomethyliaceae archaeon]
QGYREIGGIMGPRNTIPGEERYNAFIEVLQLYGLRIVREYVKEGDFSMKSGYERTWELLQLNKQPEVVLVANNLMGIGALRAIRDKGLRVPQDIGLVVFDETYVADLTDPPLTVVAQPAEEMGEIAAKCLLERIQKGDLISPREIVLSPVLVVRGSTKRKVWGGGDTDM